MRKILFYLVAGIVLISCGEKKENEKTEKVESDKKDSVVQETETVKTDSLPFDLEMFTNMEMVPFCIALPLKSYTLDEKQSDEKAKFIFTKKDNPKYYIEVRGLLRSDESVSLEDYFANSTSEEETEAQGKIITQKLIRADKNCFVTRGYWSNFPEQEFVEITFLQKEDVVTFYWSYDMETESSINYKIVQAIIQYGTECRE